VLRILSRKVPSMMHLESSFPFLAFGDARFRSCFNGVTAGGPYFISLFCEMYSMIIIQYTFYHFIITRFTMEHFTRSLFVS